MRIDPGHVAGSKRFISLKSVLTLPSSVINVENLSVKNTVLRGLSQKAEMMVSSGLITRNVWAAVSAQSVAPTGASNTIPMAESR
jgi:hypothetical protein